MPEGNWKCPSTTQQPMTKTDTQVKEGNESRGQKIYGADNIVLGMVSSRAT